MMITFCRVSHGLHWTVYNPACGTKQCVDVTFVDDAVLESVSHLMSLWTSGLNVRITLNPVDGIIYIRINDEGEFQYW